ncbi:hypothetical protein O3P69_004726 [Scylla paramamosain]|uniref:Uncharacterized protein n=1 Tax=Scylla paramamosain TaxID=85552 RepID=A0AAW0UD95_SCYPA
MAGRGEWVGVAVAAVACLYQVSLNWRRLQAGTTWLTVQEGMDAPLTPPITLCAFPTLDPRGLLPLGLRLHPSNLSQARYDMLVLAGVPADTPVGRVVQAGAWGVSGLVREVWVGSLREEYSPGSTAASALWEEVTEEGPCLRLRPRRMHAPTNISIKVQTSRYLLAGAAAAADPQVSMARRLLQRYFFVSVRWPGVSRTYMTSRTALPQPLWDNTLTLESYSVSLLSRDAAPPAAACRSSCHAALAGRESYCLLLPPRAVVGRSCSILMDMSLADACLLACRSDALTHKWRRVAGAVGGDEHEHHVQLLGTHRWLRQEYVYPTSRFLSDLGGSLGLFLGVSLSLLMLEALRLGAALGGRGGRDSRGQQQQQQRRRGGEGVCALSVHLAAALLMAVHALSSLTQLAAPPRTSVRLVPAGTTALNNLSLHDVLAATLASRAFGCRLPSAADPTLQCLLEDARVAQLGVAPFTSLQDLPLCTQSVLQEFPAIRYVLPVTPLTPTEVQAARCREEGKARGARHSGQAAPVRASVTQEHMGALRLLVEVGGIVGLYFGFSVYEHARRVMGAWSGRQRRCGEASVAVVLAGVAVGACCVQLHEYLLRRPVSVAVTSLPLVHASPVALTLCPWPPLNTTTLRALAAQAAAEGDDDSDGDGGDAGHARQQQQQTALADALAHNASFLTAAWQAAQWRVEELVYAYYDGQQYRNVYGVMAAQDSGVRLQYSLHAAEEPPLLGEPSVDELADLIQTEKVLSAITTYRSLGHRHAPPLGRCFRRCTHVAAAAEAGCAPPRASDALAGSATRLFCNASVARRLVLWALQDAVGVPPPLELFGGQREFCLAACSRSPRTLLTLRVNGREVTAPSIAIHAQDFMAAKDDNLDVRTLLEEYDAYPPASLLSDAGSLLSMLLGLSLVSLGRCLLRLLGNTPRIQDRALLATQGGGTP